MTTTPLFTVGTPLGDWLDESASLLASAGLQGPRPAFARWHDEAVGPDDAAIDAGLRSGHPAAAVATASDAALEAEVHAHGGGADPRACWTAEDLARRFPDSRFLVVVETPARAVARALASGRLDSPELALRLWVDGARQLVEFLRRHVRRCLAVDESDLRTRPLATACRVAAWAGAKDPTTVPPRAGAEPAAVWSWIAGLVVGRDADCGELHAELLACCIELGAGDARAVVDTASGIAALREWQRQAQRCATLEAAQAAQALRIASLDAELDGARKAEAAARRDADLILPQLHEAQEGYEKTYRRLVDAERRLAADGDVDALRRRLADAEAARDAAQAQRREADAKAQEARGALETAKSAGRRDADLLLQQLHNVQLELEAYYEKWRASSGRPAATSLPGGMSAQAIEFGTARDQAPHRELAIELHGVRLAGGELPDLDVRLVDHNEHAGLVVFSTGARQLFSSWAPAGKESGRDFMLLVPEDPQTVRLIERMPTGDWLALVSLADAIEAALRGNKALAPRWHVTALRLRALLQAQPERLRYDDVAVHRAEDDPSVLVAEYHNAIHGARALAGMRLRWSPAGGVQLAFAQAQQPPLLHWPVEAGGGWAARFALPAGPGSSAAEKRRRWLALPMQDRALLLGLLDALPGVAQAAPPDAVPAGYDRERLVAAATQPLRETLRAIDGSRLHRAARAFLRRGR